ncbi:transcription and mRNA export factor ENY2-like [Sarcophilus harrisii]|uniref:transcription and mRNA export factor ENY2-like n=1 Tax=Sarcophilus harrisii TaxID=9305 RepID=UPI0013019FA3|nr:transcription and mRNA export factor ENY2-like [Sarcophilus harrisii]
MNRDAQMKAILHQKLIETGERERLQERIRAKFLECGWKDQLQAHCRAVIQEKGVEQVNVDTLVAELTPKARALVPDSFKEELLQRVRTFLAQQVPESLDLLEEKLGVEYKAKGTPSQHPGKTRQALTFPQ